MIRRLYDWTLAWAAHPRAMWVLAFVSFVESSVFPIPPDVLLIPMVLAAPRRAWLIAAICTVSSVAGALLGYAIGALAFEAVGEPILVALGKADGFAAFRALYEEWGIWVVLAAGVTPFPFKVVTIMSGLVAFPLLPFLVSAIVARGLRFFLVAALLWRFGTPVRDIIERRLGLVFSVAVAALVGGFLLLGAL